MSTATHPVAERIWRRRSWILATAKSLRIVRDAGRYGYDPQRARERVALLGAARHDPSVPPALWGHIMNPDTLALAARHARGWDCSCSGQWPEIAEAIVERFRDRAPLVGEEPLLRSTLEG